MFNANSPSCRLTGSVFSYIPVTAVVICHSLPSTESNLQVCIGLTATVQEVAAQTYSLSKRDTWVLY